MIPLCIAQGKNRTRCDVMLETGNTSNPLLTHKVKKHPLAGNGKFTFLAGDLCSPTSLYGKHSIHILGYTENNSKLSKGLIDK